LKKQLPSEHPLSAENEEIEEMEEQEAQPAKKHVVEQLEKQAKDGYEAKKAIAHPLPPEMFKKLTRFLDKYGEDFEVNFKLS
jgi:hypothetical protein